MTSTQMPGGDTPEVPTLIDHRLKKTELNSSEDVEEEEEEGDQRRSSGRTCLRGDG